MTWDQGHGGEWSKRGADDLKGGGDARHTPAMHGLAPSTINQHQSLPLANQHLLLLLLLPSGILEALAACCRQQLYRPVNALRHPVAIISTSSLMLLLPSRLLRT